MSFSEGGLRLPHADDEEESLALLTDDFGVVFISTLVSVVCDALQVVEVGVRCPEVDLDVPHSSQARKSCFDSPQCSKVQAEQVQDMSSFLLGFVA